MTEMFEPGYSNKDT